MSVGDRPVVSCGLTGIKGDVKIDTCRLFPDSPEHYGLGLTLVRENGQEIFVTIQGANLENFFMNVLDIKEARP